LPAAARVEPFPAGFRAQEIKANGATIYVRVGGQGPAVVMLHGFGDTGDMWAPLAKAMAKDHTVIVPDLRGMGLSSHPDDSGYDKKSQAKGIALVMETLKVEKADSSRTTSATWSAMRWPRNIPTASTKWVIIDAHYPVSGRGRKSSRARCSGISISRADVDRLVKGRERIYLDRFYNELSAIRSRSTKRPATTTQSCTPDPATCTPRSISLPPSARMQKTIRFRAKEAADADFGARRREVVRQSAGRHHAHRGQQCRRRHHRRFRHWIMEEQPDATVKGRARVSRQEIAGAPTRRASQRFDRQPRHMPGEAHHRQEVDDENPSAQRHVIGARLHQHVDDAAATKTQASTISACRHLAERNQQHHQRVEDHRQFELVAEDCA